MALDKSTGSSVSINGRRFEELVKEICDAAGYTAIVQQHFNNSRNLFGGMLTVDVFLLPSKRFPEGLIIECSRQNSAGSGDHKIPHKIWTAVESYPKPSILILDGDGFEEKTIAWAKARVNDDWCKRGNYKNLLGVFTLPEFLEYIGLSPDWLIKRAIEQPKVKTLL